MIRLPQSWFRYAREFMNVYSDMPRFLLMHQSLLSHDDINLVQVEDEHLAQVLTLSTPFDIYSTLMDVLHLPSDLTTVQDTNKRSLSLFRPISEDRTCAQAGVEPHWCTCLNWQDSLTTYGDRAIAEELALAIVEVINRQLKNVFHLCAKLHLKEVIEAKKLVPNEGLLKYKNVKDSDGFVPDLSGNTKAAFAHYQIKLRTRPGNAIYEVTLFYDFKMKEVHIDLASISHPNKFGDAPHCIINQNYFLASYCVCHDKV
ncbi:hypothetical protein COOONC_06822 [Cooperia oncophora]